MSVHSEVFSAGRLKYFSDKWREITTDENILEIVENCKIEFKDDSTPKQNVLYEPKFNTLESDIIDKEIETLLENGAIIETSSDPDKFLSTIFARPKKNGEYRVILNLKKLNEWVPYRHFKMDTFESAVNLIKKDCFMASIDIRHAYHSIPIAEEHQKFLRFKWKGKIFQYTCLPFGLASAPRIFTKVLKPIFAKLRMLGYVNVTYIDDILLLGDSKNDCKENVKLTRRYLERLGFVIHEKKSIFEPVRKIVFLGNIIDSEKMTIELSEDKKCIIQEECRMLCMKFQAKIRSVARVIGLIIASLPAVELGPLHYRVLEREKIEYLKNAKGDFEVLMPISEEMKKELQWWISNIHSQTKSISRGNPDITIKTDASLMGWGAVVGKHEAGGRWNQNEEENHINYLEMLAIFFALRSFENYVEGKYVKILSDNTTAISYINNMGGIKSEKCNGLAIVIWEWCLQRNIWLICSHIPGKNNDQADRLSREFNDQIEWQLDKSIFLRICEKVGRPDIDLFASRLNTQLKVFCSWKPDPECTHVNAFSLHWGSFKFVYIFPPFSVLSLCVRKIQEDKARGIIIAPLWPTQTWFAMLMKILVTNPLIIPKRNNLLANPQKAVLHPLRKKMVLIACQVSGELTECMEFLEKQPPLSWHHGEPVLKNNINLSTKDGFSTALNGKLIQFHQL